VRQPPVKVLSCLSAFAFIVLAALGALVAGPSGPLRAAGTGWTSSLRPASTAGLGSPRAGATMKTSWRQTIDRAGWIQGAGWGLAADMPGSGAVVSLPSAGTTASGSAAPPPGWVTGLQHARAPPAQRQSTVP
jgi:hypothetical protein